MTKIIWLTDLHLVSKDSEPASSEQNTPLMNLRRCLSEVSKHHPDAARLVISGDLIHMGHKDAYETLRAELNRIQIPYRLLVGNHDDRAALLKTFPEIVAEEGFIQGAEDLGGVRILYLDTLASEEKHTGELCQKRLSWLQKQVTTAKDAPLIIFMHHPPSKLGIPALDRLRLEDSDMLSDILKMHGGNIQVLSGHVHRNASGRWCGYGFSTLKSLFVQFEADMKSTTLQRSTEVPGYGVILFDQGQHVLNFIDLIQDV